MADNQPIYRFLPKKRSELLPPMPPRAPVPTPTSTPSTEQSEIRLERVNSSMPPTESIGNSGWDVADLLKEWRLDGFT